MIKTQLLDEVKIKGKTLTGVVDYVTPMYVTFFDISMVDDPNLIRIVLMWRMSYSHMRFSIFRELFFRELSIPSPNMLNRKKIEHSSVSLEISRPSRTVKKITKKS